MTRYAQVIVDISAGDVNQVYDYLIPEQKADEYEIGHLVKVPFGRRKVKGFIIGISDDTEIEKDRLKEILEKCYPQKLFDEQLLSLFKWMAGYYNSYLVQVIRAAVPAGFVRGRVKVKKKRYVCRAKEKTALADYHQKIESKAPKQAQVLEVFLHYPEEKFTFKELTRRADCYRGAITRLVEEDYLKVVKEVDTRKPYRERSAADSKSLQPTEKQQEIIDTVTQSFGKSQRFLLHGVTGSGKTEVYMKIIRRLINSDRGAIVLVPEISLTPVMVRRFYSRFGEKVAVFHSNLSEGERFDEWRRINQGQARIVIGARSAIFAPVKNLGIIIIDEEHETSYKQETYPHYHARRVAYIRGKIRNIPVLLGSATPALESYYYARQNHLEYLSLPERIHAGKLPPVKIIDMREELKEGNTGIFSRQLENAVVQCLEKGEQVLLFLNRRGYASFVLCRECGSVVKCKNCDISLTYHSKDEILRCHYCDYTSDFPRRCPECESKYIKDFGIGTEKIEELVKEKFPRANVERMDVDTTGRKGSHRKILQRVESGEIDILIGTQMIAKGHDYPNIGVVGVISADTILNLPDFRSSERTFQLLTQVAGRTGRGKEPGQVYVQTYSPDHYSIRAARNHNYKSFYEQEINLRKELDYPPFCYLVNIIIKSEQKEKVRKKAQNLGDYLQKKHRNRITTLLGPSPAPINRLRGSYRWQIILKFTDKKLRKQTLQDINRNFFTEKKSDVKYNIDVDPQSML
ncbi:MAG: primosomal protein N' [Bacillota bacterium]